MLNRNLSFPSIVLTLLVAITINSLAQDTRPLTATDALNIAFDIVEADAGLVQIEFDANNGCWYIEFDDDMTICISEVTGELVERAITPTPEVTVTVTPEVSSIVTPIATTTLPTVPTVSVEDAIIIALRVFPNSNINAARLIQDDDILFWDIELDERIRSVDINAITGDIIFFGYVRSGNRNSNANNTSEASRNEFSEPNSQEVSERNEASEYSEVSEQSEVSEHSEVSERSEASD